MIPTLYDKTGAVKIGDLNDCIECLVEEERNGIFELTMIYPANSSILESIVYDNIIVADANDYLKSQKFRVYNTRKLMANRIEICARHISFDLVHDWVDVISIENQSCEYALNTIFKNSQFSNHFKGYSDIVNAQNFKVNKVTCLEAIGGTSGSIIDTYGTGAEILRDNTNIHVLNRRGHDNDVVIEYRKNLTGLEVEEDTTDLITRIMPYAIYTNSSNEEVEVRGDFVDSPLINNYAHPYVKYMDYSEKFEDSEVPTKTKLNNLAAKEYTNNKVDIPKNNYKIEFIPLSKCAGYEGLEDRINLCDVVTIKDSRYNIDTQAKVIKVVFDVLRGRYDSMELGEPRTTLGDIIGGTGDGPTQGPPGPPGPQGPAGADGSIGDFPQTLPAVPTITAKVYGFANIELSWTFENKVYYSYELYASKTKGFTPNSFNLIFSGQASTFLYQVNPNETWYFRACALNTHGQRTGFSEEVKASTVKISDLSNYVESAAIGDALIGELNLGRGWYGELKGNYIDARQLSVTDGSGKRTLDIDSFGNVNLDVTSLKIKNNSVATESFVSNAKNDAINSANNNTTIALENHYTKSETDSKISVVKDEINLGVSNTYETKTNVETKINGVAIGGTNLLLNSHFDYDRNWQKGTGVTRVQEGFDGGYCMKTVGALKETRSFSQGVSFAKLEKGQQYTATVWLKTQDVVRGTTNPHLYFFASYFLNNKWVTERALSKAIPNGTTAWTKYVLTFTMPTENFDVMSVEGYARDFTGTIWWDGIKLEKGNKASDWSPSPLDISADITNAKTEAINTASTDATNKANNAKNEAINSANNALTTTIANYYTKAQTDSQIKVAKDAINLGVSQTYETKTNVETKIEAIQVGGTNLVKQSKLLTDVTSLGGWHTTETGNEGFKKLEIVTTDTSWQECSVPLYTEINTITKAVTISFEYQETTSELLLFSLGAYNGGTRLAETTNVTVSSGFKVISTNNGWKTVYCTFDPTSINGRREANQYRIQFKKVSGKTGTINVRKLKLEVGTKATTWSPAPEDTISDINDAKTTAINTAATDATNKANNAKNEAINSANATLTSTIANYYTKSQTDSQIKVAKDAITQSVSSTYETKTSVTNKINGVNSSISSLQTRMNTAESKITDTAITNTVKQNFYTKTETDGKVTTVQNSMNSSITQLSNQIATKVDVNGVLSTIQQNPNSIQIGFNKISNALTIDSTGMIAKTQNGNKYFQLGYNGMTMYNPANGTHQWGKVAAINNKFTVASNGNSSGLSLGHHVNENYVEDILCDSNGVVHIQRQTEHNGVYYNNYGQMFIRQSGQGGWEITGRSDSQAIKPGGANQGAVGSNTQYINQSWIANRQNPSSLEYKHLSHYVEDLECIKLVSEVQPARFFYKEYDEEGNDITTFTARTSQLGLIYEDVRECSGRDLLTNEEDKAINSYGMVSVLWGAVRNLNKRLNELEVENLNLNNKLNEIKATQKEVI